MTSRPPTRTTGSGGPAARVAGSAAALPTTDDDIGERNRQSLRDIVDFGSLAGELVGRGRESYDEDRLLRLAAEAVIIRIGEAVARLDPAFVNSHPEVPFRQAKDMRNLVSHAYHRSDPDILWSTLTQDIPPFCAQVIAIVRAWDRLPR